MVRNPRVEYLEDPVGTQKDVTVVFKGEDGNGVTLHRACRAWGIPAAANVNANAEVNRVKGIAIAILNTYTIGDVIPGTPPQFR